LKNNDKFNLNFLCSSSSAWPYCEESWTDFQCSNTILGFLFH